jgi:hypothetical protein
VAGAEDEKQKDKASVSKKMTAYVHAGPSENVLENSICGRLMPSIKKGRRRRGVTGSRMFVVPGSQTFQF